MSLLITGRRQGSVSPPTARLQLTSLVDMMVILVVFLLMSFSVEGQLLTPMSGLELPVSSIDEPVIPGLVIELGLERLRIGGRDLMDTADIADQAALLHATLDELTAVGPVSVTVQCDRRLDFRILGRVLRACGRAGVTDLSLLVMGGES